MTQPKFYTVVIKLPDDQVAAKTIMPELPIFGEFHGGEITGAAIEDALSINDQLEQLAGHNLAKQAQEQAEQLNKDNHD